MAGFFRDLYKGYYMPCFHPMQAYSDGLHPSGKRRIRFYKKSRKDYAENSEFKLPCGQCSGCRLEYSRRWAIRCVHEASIHEQNCFITLTYDDEHLPNPPSLDLSHFQLFMKRLRKRFGNGIRFFHCGEYGEKYGRPHYHACLFGFDFSDRVFYTSRNGVKLFTSQVLSELWPYGFSSVGDVTFESAAYVARYVMKKVGGKDKDKIVPRFYSDIEDIVMLKHYERFDSSTGEIYLLKPEYTTMSRGGKSAVGNLGGIGKPWFDKYRCDVYPFDEVILRDVKMRPPKYYDSLYEIDFPDRIKRIKEQRVLAADEFSSDNTYKRLLDREKCQLAKLGLLKRDLE